jgi:membrane protein YqaA with SNARE-associated domain|tara:strand:+ start:1948 stop:2499 length:552 start_codon:yes stop_codon:yes gene_type:complete
MGKKDAIRFSLAILNFLVIFLLIWSLVNYTFLSNEVSRFVQIGGLIAMIFLVILLEGAPVFIGPGLVVAAILAMGVFNPWFILLLFLVSVLIGNAIYFYLGYSSGKGILKYFDKKDVKKYERLFKKYGFAAMIITAISPIPYLPTIAGVFKMTSPILIIKVLFVRAIRHLIIFLFWFYILVSF